MTPRLGWMRYEFPAGSLAKGYASSAEALRRALVAAVGDGLADSAAAEHGDEPPASVLHYCPPHFFRPVEGALNALFTMWEAPVLPDDVVEDLRRADRLIVPSSFCAETWGHYGLCAAVAPLGVGAGYLEADAFRPSILAARRRLRFLWVGSSSQRKGWDLIAPSWREAWGGSALVEHDLTVKTIGDGTVADAGLGVTIDQRELDDAAMLDLYRSADVVLHFSRGEGFGLTLLEGMAAGCLAIAVPLGGVTDFFHPGLGLVPAASRVTTATYGGKRVRFPEPGPRDVAACIRAAVSGWGSPEIESLRLAGVRSARRFTWAGCAARVLAAALDERSALLAEASLGAAN